MVNYYMPSRSLREFEDLLANLVNDSNCCVNRMNEIQKSIKILTETHEKQTRELEYTKRELENQQSKKTEIEETFKGISLRLKETKEIIQNTKVIVAIVVDEKLNYNLRNGLADTNRDVVMKLVKIVKNEMKVRNIIGMGKIFYEWSKKPIFLWARKICPTEFLVRLLPREAPRGVTYLGNNRMSFTDYKFTISVDCRLPIGKIYVLDLHSKGHNKLGLAEEALFPALHMRSWFQMKGTCTIFYDCICVGMLYEYMTGWNAKESTHLLMELDTSICPSVLHLFADGVQITHAITAVPQGVFFVLGLQGGFSEGSLEVVSLRTVAKTMADRHIQCKEHIWR